MNVTIAGTGNMARAIATRALVGGHEVSFVGTHISKAEDLADELSSQGPVRSAEAMEGDILVPAVPRASWRRSAICTWPSSTRATPSSRRR